MKNKKIYIIVSFFLILFIIISLIFIDKWYKDNIIEECRKIVEGKNSDYINKLDLDLVKTYEKGKDLIINKGVNEYYELKNIKNGDCDKIAKKNKKSCIYYKNKILPSEEGTFEYIILKSLFNNENLCSTFSDKLLIQDCKLTLQNFLNLDKPIEKENIMLMNSFEIGKTLVEYGTGKFIQELDKDFIDTCIAIK